MSDILKFAQEQFDNADDYLKTMIPHNISPEYKYWDGMKDAYGVMIEAIKQMEDDDNE